MENTTLKTTLKVFSIICIILGGLAIIGDILDLNSESGYALIGGGLFVAEGWLALKYISRNKKAEK